MPMRMRIVGEESTMEKVSHKSFTRKRTPSRIRIRNIEECISTKTVDRRPKPEEYILSVSIPDESSTLFLGMGRLQNLNEAEEYFINEIEKADSHEAKINLDRVRALLKYAYHSNARLVNICQNENKFKIDLGFSSMENMSNFHDTMGEIVASSTMK